MLSGARTTADPITHMATELVQGYKWQFVTEPQLVHGAHQAQADRHLAAAELTAGDVRQWCLQTAGHLLYQGCNRRPRDEGAYRDLYHYLLLQAPALAPPHPTVEWVDLVQETLLDIYRQPAACRVPAAFLAWALTILKRKGARSWDRRTLDSLEKAQAAEDAALHHPDPHDRHQDPLGDQELLGVLHDCLANDEERGWAVWHFYVGLKRREWAMAFDGGLRQFDRLQRVVIGKLRHCDLFLLFMAR